MDITNDLVWQAFVYLVEELGSFADTDEIGQHPGIFEIEPRGKGRHAG